jgi:hypothetical protein
MSYEQNDIICFIICLNFEKKFIDTTYSFNETLYWKIIKRFFSDKSDHMGDIWQPFFLLTFLFSIFFISI